MGYTIDMKELSLMKYKNILQNQTLLPSRKILLDDLEAKFERIANAGINNLHDLKNILSSPSKLLTFSAKTNISEDYFIILKRELGSLEQKPVPIANFPGINKQTALMLQNQNIKTSKDFYNYFQKEGDAKKISILTGIATTDLDELYYLCNLVRINGVGAAAARTLLESGYKDIQDIAHTNANDLLDKITKVNSFGHYYNAKLGLKDMQFIIDYANLLLQTGKGQGQ